MQHAAVVDLVDRHRELNKEIESLPEYPLTEIAEVKTLKRERCTIKTEVVRLAHQDDGVARAYALEREWVTQAEFGWSPEILDGDDVSPTIELPIVGAKKAAA